MAALSNPGTKLAATRWAAVAGLDLYAERALQFRFEQGAWYVPCRTVEGRTYAVRLEPVEACECKDFGHRGDVCEHVAAARIAHAKSRVCSCCGERVLGRFLSEVTEEDGLLSWFVGDELCGDCVKAGYWV